MPQQKARPAQTTDDRTAAPSPAARSGIADPLVDPLGVVDRPPPAHPEASELKREGAPAVAALPGGSDADALPLIPLPSRFKPDLFHKASATPGQRSGALKAVDAHLAAVDATSDPLERFERLKQLQSAVDAFVRRHEKESSPRVATTFALKQWLDGAVRLREPLFAKIPKGASPADADRAKPDAVPPTTTTRLTEG